MKNNINYYPHKTESHNHWKFKALRRKYGWAGEGRFWALNNMIGDAEDCMLNISGEDCVQELAADIDLSIEDFQAFIDFLVDKAKLIVRDENYITTDKVQEALLEVNKKRRYQRDWHKGKSNIEKDKQSIESKDSNIENEFSNIEKEQSKLNKTKSNEIKEKNSPRTSSANISLLANEFIEKFNSIKSSKYQMTDKVMRSFGARIREKFSVEQMIIATQNCFNEPFHKENPNYLTPEFILRPEKLEKYLNWKTTNKTFDNGTKRDYTQY